jgi:hypothetical protein
MRERDEAIWAEVMAGGTLKAVGAKYGISGERARQITSRVSRSKGMPRQALGSPGQRRSSGAFEVR